MAIVWCRAAAMLAAVAVFTAEAPVDAAEYHTLAAADGTRIDYAVVLPPGFDPAQSHPVLVALPPGGQDRDMVEAGLGFWQDEGPRRGYVVVSPAAPGGKLFFNDGAAYLAEFLEQLGERYDVAGGKFHLTGISNGGLSAFRAAIDRPELFHSLTVLPGFPPAPEDMARLDRLLGIHITMVVGARDRQWIDRMEAAADELARLGADVQYVMVPEAGHVIRSLAGTGSARLFNLIEK
jgi:predicted esterase